MPEVTENIQTELCFKVFIFKRIRGLVFEMYCGSVSNLSQRQGVILKALIRGAGVDEGEHDK